MRMWVSLFSWVFLHADSCGGFHCRKTSFVISTIIFAPAAGFTQIISSIIFCDGQTASKEATDTTNALFSIPDSHFYTEREV
ncbi:hypothetical protein A9973_05300 [Achromobacter sp. UMC46]|nr:hypothetical protein [Achromobacter sp. UMC46]